MAELPPTTGDVSPVVRAYVEIQHLKQLFRRGWLRSGVPETHCESVADHSFATALLAMLLADRLRPELDVERVLRMALLHDLGEAYAGDLTPADGVSGDEKHRREAHAVRQILGKLPGGSTYLVLWEEYERQDTAEARFVRRVDRLEMALQAVVYGAQHPAELGEFLDSAAADVNGSELQPLLDELKGMG